MMGKGKTLFYTWKSVPAVAVAAVPVLLETKALEKHIITKKASMNPNLITFLNPYPLWSTFLNSLMKTF